MLTNNIGKFVQHIEVVTKLNAKKLHTSKKNYKNWINHGESKL